MRRFAFALFLVAACSNASSDPAPGPTVPPAAEPPPPCDDGTYRTLAGSCVAYPSLGITRSPVAITPVRDHHTTAVIETAAGPYLYVFGGTDAWTVIHLDVQRAKIGDDGSLSPFEAVGNLPEPRAGHCMVKVKDRWLVAGGTVTRGGHMNPDPSTLLVRLGDDGKVAEITPGPDLPKGVMHLTCDVAGDYVYALGGRGTNSFSTTMSTRARIAPDGTLGAWENQSPLKPDRSHHAAFVRGTRVYVVGGLTGNPIGNKAEDRTDAIFADIDADGALGEWMPAGKLPESLSVSSAQLYDDAVYLVGGLEGELGGFSDKIRRATFNDDGTLSDFTTLKTKLPDARGHVHETPMYKGFLFSVAGQDDSGSSLGTVDIGHFTE